MVFLILSQFPVYSRGYLRQGHIHAEDRFGMPHKDIPVSGKAAAEPIEQFFLSKDLCTVNYP